jgi:hypothetical protein
MSHPSRKTAASVHTVEVVVLKDQGRRLHVLGPLPFAPGTAVQLRVKGKFLQGEVDAPVPQHGQSEAGIQAPEAPPCPSHSHPNWGVKDSVESVMGSLLALNARLMFYEEREQAS